MVVRLRPEQAGSSEFLDTFYTILAAEPRRRVLRELLTRRGPITVERLAVGIAGSGGATPESDPDVRTASGSPSDRRHEDAALALRHVHLPLLEDAGVLTWDRESGLVALTPVLDRLTVTVPSPDGFLDLSVSPRPETS